MSDEAAQFDAFLGEISVRVLRRNIGEAIEKEIASAAADDYRGFLDVYECATLADARYEIKLIFVRRGDLSPLTFAEIRAQNPNTYPDTARRFDLRSKL